MSQHHKQVTAELSLAAALTAVIFFVATAFAGANPLLGGSELYGDFANQYVGLMNYLHQVVIGQAHASYSFGNGLGGSMIGNWAYYLLSPFNLLALPFGPHAMPTVLFCLIWLKLTVSAITMNCLIRARWSNLRPLVRVSLSLAYSLMGYAVTYQREFMWLDALVFLPLIIIGLLRLIAGRSGWMYAVWLGVMLVANYYLGFMICVFLPFFAGYLIWADDAVPVVDDARWRAYGRFVGASFLGGLSAAGVLLPTFMSLVTGKLAAATGTPILAGQHQPIQLLARLLVGAVDDHVELNPGVLSVPTVYVGGVALGAALLFVTLRQLRVRQRLAAVGLTAWFVLVGHVPALYLLMHGGANPVGYPYRYAFLVSFWCLYLAADTLTAAQDGRVARGWTGLLAVCALAAAGVLYWQRVAVAANTGRIALTLAFWWGGLALLQLRRTRWRRRFAQCLLLLTVMDMGVNAWLTTRQTETADQADYRQYVDEMAALTAAIKTDAGNNTQPYRVGSNLMRGIDRGDGLSFGFASASVFSSNLAAGSPQLMRRLGQMGADYFIQYSNGTALTDSILGMRYLVTTTRDGKQETAKRAQQVFGYRRDVHGRTVTTHGKETVVENALALPLAFVLPGRANVTLPGGDSLANQARVLQAWSGRKQALLQSVKLAAPRHPQQGVTTYRIPASKQVQYLQLAPAFYQDDAEMTLDGTRVQTFAGYATPIVLGVGAHAKPLTLKVKQKAGSQPLPTPVLMTLRRDDLRRAVNKLQARSLHFTTPLGPKMAATVITRRSQQTIMTTIPHDTGWQVKVDGHVVKTGKALMGVFMTIPLQKAGEHRVTFWYRTPYLRLGLLVSGIAWLGIFALAIHDLLKKRGARARHLV